MEKELNNMKLSVVSLIESVMTLKDYCLDLQKIGDDQQKIIEQLNNENIQIKKRLLNLEDYKINKDVSEPKTSLPPLPSLSALVKS